MSIVFRQLITEYSLIRSCMFYDQLDPLKYFWGCWVTGSTPLPKKKNIMLVKTAGNLENECMSTNSQYKRMEKLHQSPATLKVRNISTKICCSQCWNSAHQNFNTHAHPGADSLSWHGYSNCTVPIGINQFV